MRNQLYTNAILTVIAAALVYLCIVQTALPPTVRAASQTYSVPVLKGACPTCPGGPLALLSSRRVSEVTQKQKTGGVWNLLC
jgi:hypothetical protein